MLSIYSIHYDSDEDLDLQVCVFVEECLAAGHTAGREYGLPPKTCSPMLQSRCLKADIRSHKGYPSRQLFSSDRFRRARDYRPTSYSPRQRDSDRANLDKANPAMLKVLVLPVINIPVAGAFAGIAEYCAMYMYPIGSHANIRPADSNIRCICRMAAIPQMAAITTNICELPLSSTIRYRLQQFSEGYFRWPHSFLGMSLGTGPQQYASAHSPANTIVGAGKLRILWVITLRAPVTDTSRSIGSRTRRLLRYI
ncbi:hypothetical protein QBC44DRAFT_311526 [Cladorrhinum sp. PSN332]|nr:hypothetical protein QBC44DRAFT_311526 [Cladorrhinum sp. PSN332]